MRGIRDDFSKYQAAGVVVFGISPDPAETQAEFSRKENLPFHLLADTEHAVAEKYGVWIEKSMYGRKYWGNERTSFLIDANGHIEQVFRKVDPKTHSQQVLAVL